MTFSTGGVFALVSVSVACALGAPPADFEDPLIGPVSEGFDIPFDSYSLTPAGLLRKTSPSGIENGIERPIIRTKKPYLTRDFVFEVDLTIPSDHGDIAYVGFGEGAPNLNMDNEPSYAVLFRVHNLPRMPHYGIDFAVSKPDGGK